MNMKAKAAYGFLSGWYFLLSMRYALFISCSEACLSMPKSWNQLVIKLMEGSSLHMSFIETFLTL